MFGWITRFSMQFRILVLAVAAGLIAFGVVNVPHVAIDSMPEFAPAHVEIQTEAWASQLPKSNSSSPLRWKPTS